MDGSIKNSPPDALFPSVSRRILVHPEHPNLLNKVTPWELDFRQMGPGDLQSEVIVHGGADCMVSRIRMNCAVHQTGAPPPGCLTFGIPDVDGLDSWQARDLPRDPLLSFGAATGFDSCSNERHVGLTLAFSETALTDFACRVGQELPESAYLTHLFEPAEQMKRLEHLKQKLKGLLKREDVIWTEPLFEHLALDVFVIMCGAETEYDDRPLRNRRYVLGKAIELMDISQENVIQISKLCAEVGTSWRTLNRAFLDEFGFGPKTYFNRLRLNSVRLEFLRAEGKTSVTDAANRFDFWHMGQFAKDYSKLFGERPSDTLHRITTQDDPGWR